MNEKLKAVFGDPVDAGALEQIENCLVDDRAVAGALMADHHKGYALPIGGVVAYDGAISPSGVGFDIACLAEGTRVSLAEGTRSIQSIVSQDDVLCLDVNRYRVVSPNLGSRARGTQACLKLTLANGREATLTPDHQVRTQRGWVAAEDLRENDRIACNPYVGVPIEPFDLPPALVRIHAYASGDGHLAKSGKKVSIYTTVEQDATDLADDFIKLGCSPKIYRRTRGTNRPEICIDVNSVEFHRTLADLGSPVGKKRWSLESLKWLRDSPRWVRAHWLSSFASAEHVLPTAKSGWLANFGIKQADPVAAELIQSLLESLDYEASLTTSASTKLVTLLGGEDEKLRFLSEIGFCRSAERRVAAASVASVAWQRQDILRRRESARVAARTLRSQGVLHQEVLTRIAESHDVPRGFVHHSIYSDRPSRRGNNVAISPQTLGEGAWVPISSIESDGHHRVWDVATGDSAENFLADGIVVHNCGNMAAKTNLNVFDFGVNPNAKTGELNPEYHAVKNLMREVQKKVAFGMGRSNPDPVDHDLFDDEVWPWLESVSPGLKQKAEQQLGTVGSGNHYVDLLIDETGKFWVANHFGSRGLGHTIASGFMSLHAGRKFNERVPEGEDPIIFDVDSELGAHYIACMNLAGRYAYAGREHVTRQVLGIIGAVSVEEVHCHHNFAWLEDGLWIVRKGATPLTTQPAFIGGSMGDVSVIVRGRSLVNPPVLNWVEDIGALGSAPHGAGRTMSRTAAAGKLRKMWYCNNRNCDFEPERSTGNAAPSVGGRCPKCNLPLRKGQMRDTSTAAIDWPAVREDLRERGIALLGAGADEAPGVYKDLATVISLHSNIEVLHSLRPIGVVMASPDTFDPYAD